MLTNIGTPLSKTVSFWSILLGTDYYKAPEVVTNVPYNNSVDMWSLGVVTFYALAGYKPFQSKKYLLSKVLCS